MSFENPGDNIRCDHCNAYGKRYDYRGESFSGLHANRGERLCPGCLDRSVEAELNAPVGPMMVPASHYITVGRGVW